MAQRPPLALSRRLLWFVGLWLAGVTTLALAAALFQVLRNTAMKRLGHALDEYINVWGRFTFLLPYFDRDLAVVVVLETSRRALREIRAISLRRRGCWWRHAGPSSTRARA